MEISEYEPLAEAYERQNLVDVIPLTNPISMLVDPSSLCNFKCAFCPTGDPKLIKQSGRKQVFMTLELFKKVVNDINTFENDLEVLRLYKDGEPLLNPNFIEFVKIAKTSPKIKRVETTTNGSKLTREYSRELVDAGIDRVVISIEGVSKQTYKEFARVNIDFDKFIENLAYFYEISRGKCQVHIKTVRENLDTEDGEEKFKAIFGPISDRMYIENTVPSWPEFDLDYLSAEQQEMVNANKEKATKKKVCAYLFYSLSINADGVVSPCCVDWNRKLTLGDVNGESVLDVWNNDRLGKLRVSHLKNERETIDSCASCGQIDYCSMENIDVHAPMILEKLSKEIRPADDIIPSVNVGF